MNKMLGLNPKVIGHDAEVIIDGTKIFLAGKYIYDVTTSWDASLEDGLDIGELFVSEGGWGIYKTGRRSESGFASYEDGLKRLLELNGVKV